MSTRLDYDRLFLGLATLLGRESALSAKEIRRHLDLSQTSFLRLLGERSDRILVSGRARTTRYSLRRTIEGVVVPISVYLIDERGMSSLFGRLHPIATRAFFFERADDNEGEFYDDLPYFLDDLRPSGFLGKLISQFHAELRLPKNPEEWSTNQALTYLCRYGTNLVGNFVLGQEAMQLLLQGAIERDLRTSPFSRRDAYLRCALDILREPHQWLVPRARV